MPLKAWHLERRIHSSTRPRDAPRLRKKSKIPRQFWQLAVFTSFRNGDLTFGDLDLDPQGHPVKRVQLALENPEV